MADKKRPIGFPTPSMQIQEEYKDLLEQITTKKADWEESFEKCKKMYETAFDDYNNALKDSKARSKGATAEYLLGSMVRLNYAALMLGQSLTRLMIAKAGKDLSECDVRIATLEKELKDLRKAL